MSLPALTGSSQKERMLLEENDDSFVWAQPNDFSRHLSDQALCLIILAYGNERNFS